MSNVVLSSTMVTEKRTERRIKNISFFFVLPSVCTIFVGKYINFKFCIMEETYINQESLGQAGEPNELKVSELSKVNLLSIRKWTKFLAIVGLVVIILVAVAILALPFFAREYPQAAGLFIYCIFILAIYIYPLMKMFGIVKALKPAVEQCDEQQLDKAVSETKALVTFMGVLTIVVLALYALALLFAGSLLASLS